MTDQPILVTGAAGFIGSSLTDRLLSRGERVVGIDNFCDFYDPAIKRRNVQPALATGRFTLIEADIRDRDALMAAFAAHKPAAVIHLAAMAGVRPSIENPALYTAVNVDGTVNLLDAAVAHKAAKFLFASSSSVYGNTPKAPFAEDDRVDHPISPYAATKKAGELICHTYAHLYGLPIFCLRFFNVYGPRQRPDLAMSLFLGPVSQGKPIPVFGDGSASRDYTFIDDNLAGVLAALDKCGRDGRRYAIYNLGSDRPITLAELIAAIEKVVGRKAVIDRKPPRPGDVERTWADLTHSAADLGYRPTTRLEDGIARQWEWMRR